MGVRFRQHLRLQWPMILLYGGAFVVLGVALYWHLGTLLPGYSQNELATYQASLNFKDILNNPLNAPFLLGVKALTYLHPNNLLVTRLMATFCGVLTLAVFALLIRRWHDTRTAVITTLLFGMSAWFWHVARWGTPEILLFGVFLLAACGFWLKKTNHWLALLVCFGFAAALLYVPGMIWFVVLGIVWQWKTIDRVFKKHLAVVTLGTLLLVAALAPMGWAIYHNHDLAWRLLGLPEQWPSLLTIAENILKVPYHLFIHGPQNPEAWLGTAAILDAFTLTMFALGCYLYVQHFKLLRTPLFILITVVTAVLVSIGGPVSLSVIIPFMYVIAAAGISYLLDKWFEVFPRNPIARAIGWIALGLVVVLACSFHVTHYFIGWPHASATHEVYTIQKP
jgi:hypothetical protein